MELSIIIPVYNTEEYLMRCINSIVEQEVNFEYEIIIVNDGSTDKSIQIIKELGQKYNNIVIIDHKANKSLAVARKTGINSALGNYIMHIDSDDWIVAGSLKKILSVIKENNYDVLVYEYAKSNGTNINFNFKLNQNKLIFDCTNKIKIIKLFMGVCVNKLIKKEIAKNLVYGEEYMNTGEDLIYSFEIYNRSNKIGLYTEPVYIYYKNPKSLTNLITPEKYIKAQIIVYKEVAKLFKKYNTSSKEMYNVNSYLYKFLLIEILKHHCSNKNRINVNTFNEFMQWFKIVDLNRKEKIQLIFKDYLLAVVEYTKAFGVLRTIKHSILFSIGK